MSNPIKSNNRFDPFLLSEGGLKLEQASSGKILSAFEAWYKKNSALDRSELLDQYRSHLGRKAGRKPATLERHLALVGAYINWLEHNPKSVPQPASLHIVGIGASAGGLEALERFFGAEDIDPNLTYVVIQHLSPDFKSMMPEILARVTTIPIDSIEHGMEIQPGHIYLNNPKSNVRIKGNRFEQESTLLAEQTLHLPINTFFKSLAENRLDKAVGIILSGTGRDGSFGVSEIHDRGGLVLTQDAKSALYGSMPENAAVQGPAHLVLNPSEMPKAIREYIQSEKLPEAFTTLDSALITGENAFSYLLSLLQRAYGIDFNLYKNATLVRRVERRMNLNTEQSLEQYVSRLQKDAEELDALYRDMLVDVTSFFRDKEAFEFLQTTVIPDLVSRKANSDVLRVWSAACASGEEAYSIAILFQEEIEKQNKNIELKVFATDAHKDSIVRAGAGVFSSQKLEHVSLSLREKYFNQEENGRFKVRKTLRQKIIFAPHDLLSDGNFSSLDFISCRNMLIYLRPEAQIKALTNFTNGLELGGVLFLGSSEHLGNLKANYGVLNEKWRVYRKLRDVRLDQQISPRGNLGLLSRARQQDKLAVHQGWEKDLLRRLVPSGYVVDAQGNLIEIFGEAKHYVKFKAGRVNLSLSAMLDEPLASTVKSGLFHVQRTDKTLQLSTIELIVEGESHFVDVSIIPFDFEKNQAKIRHYLVRLENTQKPGNSRSSPPEELDVGRLLSLERELEFTRESLQASLQEVESTNEELQSTNEELIASNEELQSTNEELSSVNEELITVNSEFQAQNKRLNQTNNDLENLMRNTETIAVFLDKSLRLRMVTPTAFQVFELLESDLGRPITHFASFLSFGHITINDLAQKALEGQRNTMTVSLRDATRLQLSVMPYTTAESKTEGVVLKFIDVTEAEAQAKAPLEAQVRLVESLHKIAPGVMYSHVVEEDGLLFALNEVLEMLGYDHQEIKQIGSNYQPLVHPDDWGKLTQHQQQLSRSLIGQNLICEYRMRSKEGDWVWLRSQESVYERDAQGKVQIMLGHVSSIDDTKSLEKLFTLLFDYTDSAMSIADARLPDVPLIYVNHEFERITGYSAKEVLNRNCRFLQNNDRDQAGVAELRAAIREGRDIKVEIRNYRKDGSLFWNELSLKSVRDNKGQVVYFVCRQKDVTHKHR